MNPKSNLLENLFCNIIHFLFRWVGICDKCTELFDPRGWQANSLWIWSSYYTHGREMDTIAPFQSFSWITFDNEKHLWWESGDYSVPTSWTFLIKQWIGGKKSTAPIRNILTTIVGCLLENTTMPFLWRPEWLWIVQINTRRIFAVLQKRHFREWKIWYQLSTADNLSKQKWNCDSLRLV